MIGFWIIAGVLTAAVVGLLGLPLMRNAAPAATKYCLIAMIAPSIPR